LKDVEIDIIMLIMDDYSDVGECDRGSSEL